MDVTIIPVTPFEQNCSLLVCSATRQAALVALGDQAPALDSDDESET